MAESAARSRGASVTVSVAHTKIFLNVRGRGLTFGVSCGNPDVRISDCNASDVAWAASSSSLLLESAMR